MSVNKRILILLRLVAVMGSLAILPVACGSDSDGEDSADDTATGNASALVGNWRVREQTQLSSGTQLKIYRAQLYNARGNQFTFQVQHIYEGEINGSSVEWRYNNGYNHEWVWTGTVQGYDSMSGSVVHYFKGNVFSRGTFTASKY